jgi:hypothetical protein
MCGKYSAAAHRPNCTELTKQSNIRSAPPPDNKIYGNILHTSGYLAAKSAGIILNLTGDLVQQGGYD